MAVREQEFLAEMSRALSDYENASGYRRKDLWRHYKKLRKEWFEYQRFKKGGAMIGKTE